MVVYFLAINFYMSEKFFGNGGSSDWSDFRKLEAEGKARAAAAAKKNKERALLDAQQKREIKRRIAQLTKQLPKETAVNDGPHIVSEEHSPPISSVFENDDSRGDEFEHLERHRSSRRAVYEETGGRVGRRQATEIIGGRLRPGSKDLVRSNVDMVPTRPENARWKKGDQTHFEMVEQKRAREAADLKRNARRGESIRDLEEVPLSKRSESFVRDMNDLSQQYAGLSEGQRQNRYIPETRREPSPHLEKTTDKSPDDSGVGDGYARKKSGRGPRADRPFTGGRDRSSKRATNLSVDKAVDTGLHVRFTRQQNAQREQRRFTWHSLLEGIQGFFRR